MPSRNRILSLVTGFLLFSLGSGLPGLVQAQKKPDDSPGRLPPEGSEKLEKEFRSRGKELRDLAKGERPATKADTDLIDMGVKYHVYRLTWREQTKDPGVANRFINELEVVLKAGLGSKGKAAAFLEIFGRQLGLRLKELLSHEDPFVRLNAAMMLPLAARAGNPEVTPILAETVRDERQDEAVRYWAVMALRDLFAQTRQSPALRMKPEQEEAGIVALVEYLQRPPNFPDRIVRIQQNRDREKQKPREGEKDKDNITEEDRRRLAEYEGGVQFSRRAAVRALGETRYPALLKKVGGRNELDERALTALALVRVVANDMRTLIEPNAKKAKGAVPPASIGERVEAAIAICQLQSTLTKDYCPDYAANHVGRFIVDFADSSNDLQLRKLEPYKHYASKLLAALAELTTDMKKGSQNDEAIKYTLAFITRAEPILRSIETGSQPNSGNLSSWLETPVPNKSVYKNLDKAVVKPVDMGTP